MQGVNLIPASRRNARRVRGRARQCAIVCVLYAVAAAGACGAWRMAIGQEDLGIDKQLASAAADIEHANKALAEVNADTGVAQSRIGANRHILSQPDWSLLLALLGNQTGSQIVLRSFDLKPDEAAAASSSAPAAAHTGRPRAQLTLRLSGFGKSSQAVAQFGLRLEETKLFSRVTLVDTTHDTFLAGDAFAFRIECPLDDPR